MKLVKSVLVASALAFAVSGAFAKDDDKDHKGFNDIDKNADGFITRAEAKGKAELLDKWKDADKNNDGKLSRAEYLSVMAKKDAGMVKEKVKEAGREVKEEVSEAKRRAPKADDPATSGATVDSGKAK